VKSGKEAHGKEEGCVRNRLVKRDSFDMKNVSGPVQRRQSMLFGSSRMSRNFVRNSLRRIADIIERGFTVEGRKLEKKIPQ
jgi:hypothetical protein